MAVDLVCADWKTGATGSKAYWSAKWLACCTMKDVHTQDSTGARTKRHDGNDMDMRMEMVHTRIEATWVWGWKGHGDEDGVMVLSVEVSLLELKYIKEHLPPPHTKCIVEVIKSATKFLCFCPKTNAFLSGVVIALDWWGKLFVLLVLVLLAN